MRMRPGRVFLTIFLAFLLLPALTLPVVALDVPALKGRVNDYANMLSPATEQQLDSLLAGLEQSDSTQIVVLTIDSLEGDNLEQFSLKVAETWGIGQQNLDNGALLLIAKNDRKLRIEVGYGLEGKLTDLTSSRIIRNVITPRFKQGNFDQGVIEGVSAMISTVRGEFSVAENQQSSGKSTPPGTGGFFVFLFFALLNIARIFRNGIIAAGIGAVLSPLIGMLFFGAQWLMILALVPIGAVAGFIFTALFGSKGIGSSRSSSGRGCLGGRGTRLPRGRQARPDAAISSASGDRRA